MAQLKPMSLVNKFVFKLSLSAVLEICKKGSI